MPWPPPDEQNVLNRISDRSLGSIPTQVGPGDRPPHAGLFCQHHLNESLAQITISRHARSRFCVCMGSIKMLVCVSRVYAAARAVSTAGMHERDSTDACAARAQVFAKGQRFTAAHASRLREESVLKGHTGCSLRLPARTMHVSAQDARAIIRPAPLRRVPL